jgi:hypothetical protein
MVVALASIGVGCNEADEIKGDATAQAVESGLNTALSETVVPVFTLLSEIPGIISGGAGLTRGLVCPNTDSVCDGGGSVVCTTNDGVHYNFNFDQCIIATGDIPVTLDGLLVTTSFDPYQLTLTNLFLLDGTPAVNGTGEVSITGCTYTANVTSTDGTVVDGTIVQCDGVNDYPTNQSHISLALDDVQIEISFDGSTTAHAVATQGGNTVANCSINIAGSPITSSCSAP